MKTSRNIAAAAAIFLMATMSRGEEKAIPALPNTVTIDAGRTKAPISKYIYGQFIEHLGRCIYGGMWAEMLEDRKFFYPITDDFRPWSTVTDKNTKRGFGSFKELTGSPWKVIGEKGTVKMATENPYVGAHTPEVQLAGDGTARGIEQGELALIEGQAYAGRIVFAGSPTAAPIKVSLIWGEGKDDRQTITVDTAAKDFVKVPLKFAAAKSTENGRLEIVGLGKGAFRIGAVSLMPANNIEGWRADTLRLLKELDSPVYRWPGGNFVSGYNWRDGIGDPDRRSPRKNPAWRGIEHNDVGIDEFIGVCRILNTEPYVTVNTGLGSAEETAAEVEYCNGAPETPMGKLRAANGYPKPYGVKYWAIGNEMYGKWQLGYISLDEYVKKHNRCVEAMRAVDSSIQVVAVGSVGPWSERMVKDCADHMNLISEHFYCRDRQDIAEHVAQIPNNVKRIADAHRKYRQTVASLAGKDIRIALDEWNFWYGPYLYGELGTRYFLKDALGIAAGLHEYFRNSDIMFMANYAQTVNVIGAIKTTKTAAEFDATGQVLKMYRNHYGEIPVEVSGTTRPLDVAAAWTADRKALTIAVVNPTKMEVELSISIKSANIAPEGRMWCVTGPDEMAYNEPGKEPVVPIAEKTVQLTSAARIQSLTFTEGAAQRISGKIKVAPLSATICRFPALGDVK
jgi:alpha-N-arabinofuranosidase